MRVASRRRHRPSFRACVACVRQIMALARAGLARLGSARCRALPQIHRGDDGLFADHPTPSRTPSKSPRALNSPRRSRLRIPALPRARRRHAIELPARSAPRKARANATAQLREHARKSRRNSLLSKSSALTATSSSCRTSSTSARQQASSCRAAARRQQRRVLLRSASPPSIRSAWSCCSSASSPKIAASGPTSTSTCPPATSASASFNMSTGVTANWRGDDRQRDHLPRTLRRARGRQSAGVRRGVSCRKASFKYLRHVVNRSLFHHVPELWIQTTPFRK